MTFIVLCQNVSHNVRSKEDSTYFVIGLGKDFEDALNTALAGSFQAFARIQIDLLVQPLQGKNPFADLVKAIHDKLYKQCCTSRDMRRSGHIGRCGKKSRRRSYSWKVVAR